MNELIGKTFKVLDDGFVRVVDLMGDDQSIVQAARISYGEGTKKVSEDRGLIRYLMRHKHTTPFEMCLHGDTEIPIMHCAGATQKKYKLKDIVKAFEVPTRKNSSLRLIKIRTVNNDGTIEATKIKRAWKTGVKPCFRVIESSIRGRSIVVTDNHPFLISLGQYKPLRELKPGDTVYLNGVPALSADKVAKILEMRRQGKTIKEISEALNISPGSAYNYGSGVIERIPRKSGYVYHPPNTKDGHQVARRIIPIHPGDLCALCKQPATDIHHLDEDPQNNSLENLLKTCAMCHRSFHDHNVPLRVYSTTIKQIEYVGDHEVYDLEVNHSNHNFVADHFVVHNCEIKLHVRVPMDCWRQWIRHRTANVNEYSTRYSVAIDTIQETPSDQWRLQSIQNKQGSEDAVDKEVGLVLSMEEEQFHDHAKRVYKHRLDLGVAREQARKDLPLATYTEAYWKCNLHNLLHFLELRMDDHAQWEIRQYADIIGREIVAKWCPLTWEAFLEYRLNSITLSAIELALISCMNSDEKHLVTENAKVFGLVSYDVNRKMKKNREREEFENKLHKLGFDIPWKENA